MSGRAGRLLVVAVTRGLGLPIALLIRTVDEGFVTSRHGCRGRG